MIGNFHDEPITTTTGIYFDSVGYVHLYTSEWKLVTYINMEQAKNSLINVRQHIQSIFAICNELRNETWYQYSDCPTFKPYVNNKMKQVEYLKNIVADYTGAEPEPNRRKRAVLEFVGQITKILFGTLDSDDAQYFTTKINELEDDTKDFLRIAKEQMLVIKSTLTSFNSTIRDINKNEKLLKEGLFKLNDHVNKITNELYSETQLLAMMTEHILQIERSIDRISEFFKLIIDAIVHAKDGTLQPQLITPNKIRNMMSSEQPITGLDYPVNLPSHELMKLITPHIFLQGKYLVYVLYVPLLLPEQFQVFKMIPFPTPGQEGRINKYIYTESSKDYIIIDTLRQKYAKISQYQLDKCFKINELKFVCKETTPILNFKAGEDCEATLVHPSTTMVPGSCTQRMVQIDNTLWIKLLGNEWLHITPTPEIFTYVCGNDPPQSQTIYGRGKIQLRRGCKGYTAHTTIYAYNTFTTNVTLPDIIPVAPVDFDCCLTPEQLPYLDKIKLNLPLSNVLSHADELKITSHKIEEVNNLINNEKWKLEHQTRLHLMSWATTFGLVMLFLIILICCSCCCCSCCRKFGFWLYKKWQPMDCMDAMKRQCLLQQTITTGNVHYHGSTISLPVEANSSTTPPSEDVPLTDVVPIAARTRSTGRLKKEFPSWRN